MEHRGLQVVRLLPRGAQSLLAERASAGVGGCWRGLGGGRSRL